MTITVEQGLEIARRAAKLRERLRIERIITTQRDVLLGQGLAMSANILDVLLEEIRVPEVERGPAIEPVPTEPAFVTPEAQQINDLLRLELKDEPVPFSHRAIIEDRSYANPEPSLSDAESDEAFARNFTSRR